MTVAFNNEQFPDLDLVFDIEPKIFGLNIQLKHAGEAITKGNVKKHQYEIDTGGKIYKLQVSNSPFHTKLFINNNKFELVGKPKWFDYLIGGVPFLLMVSGGALGGFFGFVGWNSNMNFLRFDQGPGKYLKVLAMTLGVSITFFLLAGLIQLKIWQ